MFEILQNGGSIRKKVKFNARQGWLVRFKKRHSIRTLQAKGEKASADSESSRVLREAMTMLVRDQGYPLDNIFNADKTTLRYKSLPEETLAVRNETEISGHKQKKEQITVMLCANATGSFHLPPLCISTAKKRRCFKADTNFPCEYRETNKAWMTIKAWKPNERFFLFLYNSRIHLSAEELNKIDEQCFVLFLPPNCTSLIQPMDMGVISATKRRYRTAFLREMLVFKCKDNYLVKNFVKKWNGLRTKQIFNHA
ncbi:jerky protein homolog-like [Belonocnema kinseyi]|uniref:jerky protein homolog-like n=1 Tax=Belonocnema kinseyi TaxID=2817044 RepID=UPI00143D1211|nr:jerky protein homolog-like [Belonocnema kinseyi]